MGWSIRAHRFRLLVDRELAFGRIDGLGAEVTCFDAHDGYYGRRSQWRGQEGNCLWTVCELFYAP